MALVQMLVMYIHIGAAIMWIGGLAYLRFILLPALTRAAPEVRGPLMVDLGPRTVRFILRVAEITITAGIVNTFLAGKVMSMSQFFTTQWGFVIFLGFVMTLVIYILGQAVTRPTTLRIAATIRAVAAGRAPADAPALVEALAARQRNVLTVQLALGAAVVLMMAVARFS